MKTPKFGKTEVDYMQNNQSEILWNIFFQQIGKIPPFDHSCAQTFQMSGINLAIDQFGLGIRQ